MKTGVEDQNQVLWGCSQTGLKPYHQWCYPLWIKTCSKKFEFWLVLVWFLMWFSRTCHGTMWRPRVTSPAGWRRTWTRCRTGWERRWWHSPSNTIAMILTFCLLVKVGMLFRFIATGIGGFVYPFTQVEIQGKAYSTEMLFLRTGFSPWFFWLWCRRWLWWAESLGRSWLLLPRMRWTSMERCNKYRSKCPQ